MILLKEDKPYIIFDYDTSLVDPGPAWALYQLVDDLLVEVVHPRNFEKFEDSQKAIISLLVERDIAKVYTPVSENLELPPVLFGLNLVIDGDEEWGNLHSFNIDSYSHMFGLKKIDLIRFDV